MYLRSLFVVIVIVVVACRFLLLLLLVVKIISLLFFVFPPSCPSFFLACGCVRVRNGKDGKHQPARACHTPTRKIRARRTRGRRTRRKTKTHRSTLTPPSLPPSLNLPTRTLPPHAPLPISLYIPLSIPPLPPSLPRPRSSSSSFSTVLDQLQNGHGRVVSLAGQGSEHTAVATGTLAISVLRLRGRKGGREGGMGENLKSRGYCAKK